MANKIEERFTEIMEENRASFLVSIDQDGHLYAGFDGPTDLIIAAIGGGVVHLQRESDCSFEEIGKALNEVVDKVKESLYEDE